jgi:hypothetical protein
VWRGFSVTGGRGQTLTLVRDSTSQMQSGSQTSISNRRAEVEQQPADHCEWWTTVSARKFPMRINQHSYLFTLCIKLVCAVLQPQHQIIESTRCGRIH